MGKVNNERILVTGGNGYLGTHLVAALRKAGADVHVVVRSGEAGERTHLADVRDEAALRAVVQAVRPVIVYHLAATLQRDRDFGHHDAVMEVNYTGTLHLLRALAGTGCRQFVFASSSEVYGSNKAPFTEDQPPMPVSPYSLSKACAEMLVRSFCSLHGMDHTVLRIFNFFGKNMPAGFFLPQLIGALRSGIPFEMTAGEQARDFLYVDDVVQAMLLAIRKKAARNDTFNVCSSQSITLRELACALRDKVDKNAPIRFGALPYRGNEIWNMVGSNKKIRSKLGFRPEFSLKKGLKALLED